MGRRKVKTHAGLAQQKMLLAQLSQFAQGW